MWWQVQLLWHCKDFTIIQLYSLLFAQCDTLLVRSSTLRMSNLKYVPSTFYKHHVISYHQKIIILLTHSQFRQITK